MNAKHDTPDTHDTQDMRDKHDKHEQPGASRLMTLRLSLMPGASAINQLAAAVSGRGSARSRAGRISVSSFVFPYLPGFPILAYPGRKSMAPVQPRKSSCRS